MRYWEYKELRYCEYEGIMGYIIGKHRENRNEYTGRDNMYT